ncbi:MAG: hypothetical protein M3256_06855 [Actinomycetota bacterium]|nr:hypothetical protein [Actinomycetota bacterium]
MDAGSAPRRSRAARLKRPLAGLASSAVAAGITLAIALRLPRVLQVRTDIVGYPIHHAYNPYRATDAYFLGIAVFPVLALLLYLAVTRLAARVGWLETVGRAAPAWRPIEDDTENAAGGLLGAAGRTLAVGGAFGLEAAIIVGGGVGESRLVGLSVMVLYAALVAAAVWLRRPSDGRGHSPMKAVATLNTMAAPLLLLGLLGVSGVTSVRITSSGAVHHYPWLPPAVVLVATLGLLAFLGWRLATSQTSAASVRIERRVTVFLVGPLILFTLLSAIPGVLGQMDMFHEGERLAAGRLTELGYLPWRDLMSVHGPLEDALFPLIGFLVFEPTRWGSLAASTLLFWPLYLVFLYLLGARLFESSWAAILAFAVVLLIGGEYVLVGDRFLFWPLILLLLGASLDGRSPWLSVGFGAALAAQAIVTPEAAYSLPACGLVIILFELTRRRRGVGLLESFNKTLATAAGGLAVLLAFAIWLLAHNALGSFVFYYLIAGPGHALTGTFPVHLREWDVGFGYIALAPPAAFLLGFWYYAAKVLRRQPLDTADWIAGAAGLFAIVYYTKFLDRPDLGHAYQAYGAALPVIAFVVYRGSVIADAALRRSRWRPAAALPVKRPAGLALLISALVAFTGSLLTTFDHVPDHFRSVAASEPSIPRTGYTTGAMDQATYDDLSAILRTYLNSNDWLFDFSNEPALYYYLLAQNPRTRYYQVSMAIPEAAQQDLIGQLRRDRPKLIVFSNTQLGLPMWDSIPNMVRHYDVSQYILDNYVPLLSSHTQLIYADARAHLSAAAVAGLKLHAPVATIGLPFQTVPCDWAYAPNYLSASPPPRQGATSAVSLSLQPVNSPVTVTVTGWALDRSRTAAAVRILVTAGGQVVAEGRPGLSRPDVAASLGQAGSEMSGYQLQVPPGQALDARGALRPIRVFALSSAGMASELRYGLNASGQVAGAPVKELALADGTVAPVVSGPITGFVESVGRASQFVTQLSPPPGSSWADYRWLEIDAGSRFREDRWALSDINGYDPAREVQFNTMSSSPAQYRVYVGSCAQWHGYEQGPLYLGHSALQDVRAVRLVP